MNFGRFVDEMPSRGRRLDESEVAAFEGKLGVRLPEDYRRFLAECNGGCHGGSWVYTDGAGNPSEADIDVHHVYGLREESYLRLPPNGWWRAEGVLPRELLEIMDDSFGNLICIALSGLHRGRVFFWLLDDPDPEDWDGRIESSSAIQPIADTFAEFIERLAPEDEVVFEDEDA